MRKGHVFQRNLSVILSAAVLTVMPSGGIVYADTLAETIVDTEESADGVTQEEVSVQGDVTDIVFDDDGTVTIDGTKAQEYDYVWHVDPSEAHNEVKNSPAEYFEGTEPASGTNYIAHDIRYYPELDADDYVKVQYDDENEWAYYYTADGYTDYIFATLPYNNGDSKPDTDFMHSEEDAYNNPVFHITQSGNYRLSGEWDGQIKVDVGEEEGDSVTLILDGLDIECSVAPAIDFDELYECDADESSGSEPDTSKAGANIIIADGSENSVEGANIFRMLKAKYKDDDEQSSYSGSVKLQKKLIKEDGAFYSHVSMNIDGEDKGSGVLDIESTFEGLCSDMHMTIDGGNINIKSGDDGINTSEDDVSVFTMNGGSVHVLAGNNGSGDGIDSNGYIVINGGNVLSMAYPTSDSGLDSDKGTYINGGTVFATGSSMDGASSGSSQGTMNLRFQSNESVDDPIAATDVSGNLVFAYDPGEDDLVEESDRTWTAAVLSSEGIKSGSTYYLYIGGDVTGTDADGFYNLSSVTKISDTYKQQGTSAGEEGMLGQDDTMPGGGEGAPGDGDFAPGEGTPGEGTPDDGNFTPGDGEMPEIPGDGTGIQATVSGADAGSTDFVMESTVQTFSSVADSSTESETLYFNGSSSDSDSTEVNTVSSANIGDYVITYTGAVTYNGRKHILSTGKSNKRNSADISVSVSYNGETIDPKLYDVKFHNNKDVSNGKKEPYFVISLKKKAGAQSSVRKEFRGTKIEFTIVPADLSEIELSTTKIVSKKKGIKVSKLTATIDSLKLKLKQSKSSGKGDFTVTGYTDSNKNAVSVNGINNYKGTAIVKSK